MRVSTAGAITSSRPISEPQAILRRVCVSFAIAAALLALAIPAAAFAASASVGVPTVTNTGVTAVTDFDATLNGNLSDTGGEDPTVHVFWGPTDGGATVANWANDEDQGTLPAGDFSTNIFGLTLGATYYYRAYATNSAGEAWAPSSASFVLQTVQLPAATDSGATSVTQTEATLNGTVTATGGETPVVTIFYGTTDGGTTDADWDDFVEVGLVNGGPFSAPLADLTSGTLYYFRAQAENSAGVAWATSSLTFTTLGVQLAPPTGLTASKGTETDLVALSWNAVAGAFSYKVFRATSATDTPQELSDWIPDTSYDDDGTDGDGVAPGAVYYYWVQAAVGDSGEQPSGFSSPDFGWLGMDGDPLNFKITYKGCDLTVLDNSLVLADNAVGASIKIQRLKSLPASTAPIEGAVAYIIGSAGIPRVGIAGSVSKFFSSAPIAALEATGTIDSISTFGAYIPTISASALGSVKMTAYAMSDSSGEQFETTIYSGDLTESGTLTAGAPTLKVALTGVCLTELRAPQQTAWIGLASKKWRTPDGPDVSLAGVPNYDTNVIEAGDLRQLTTKGGEIAPARILGSAPVKGSSLIDGQGMLFKGAFGPTVYEGTVSAQQIVSGASQLTVTSLAGSINCLEILAAGEIRLLGSQQKAFRIDGSLEYHGGDLGVDESVGMMRVVSGTDTSLPHNNIARIYGSASVRGDFYAGGDGTHGVIFTGSIGQIATSKPGPNFPTAPTITGAGWSSKLIQFIGGAHAEFVQNLP